MLCSLKNSHQKFLLWVLHVRAFRGNQGGTWETKKVETDPSSLSWVDPQLRRWAEPPSWNSMESKKGFSLFGFFFSKFWRSYVISITINSVIDYYVIDYYVIDYYVIDNYVIDYYVIDYYVIYYYVIDYYVIDYYVNDYYVIDYCVIDYYVIYYYVINYYVIDYYVIDYYVIDYYVIYYYVIDYYIIWLSLDKYYILMKLGWKWTIQGMKVDGSTEKSGRFNEYFDLIGLKS